MGSASLIPVAVVVVGIAGAIVAGLYRFRAKQLEVADAQAAREEERAEKDHRHRMDYCHQALTVSDQVLRALATPAPNLGHVHGLQRDVDQVANGLKVFGMSAEAQAAHELANACASLRQNLIVVAQNEMKKAARADVAPQETPAPVQLPTRRRHRARHAA